MSKQMLCGTLIFVMGLAATSYPEASLPGFMQTSWDRSELSGWLDPVRQAFWNIEKRMPSVEASFQ